MRGAPVTIYVRINNNATALLGGGVSLTARDKDGNTVALSGLQAYNGSTAVGSATLVSSLLDADVLGLQGSNNAQITFYFTPKDGVNTV